VSKTAIKEVLKRKKERKKKKEKDPVSRRLNNGSSITHKVSMISFSLCRK
jgi:hypothetical protein